MSFVHLSAEAGLFATIKRPLVARSNRWTKKTGCFSCSHKILSTLSFIAAPPWEARPEGLSIIMISSSSYTGLKDFVIIKYISIRINYFAIIKYNFFGGDVLKSSSKVFDHSRDLTKGSVLLALLGFAAPYLVATFAQTFYALADLFIVGLFCDTASVAAVALGGQVMHLVTVVIAALTTGVTVAVAHRVGASPKVFSLSFLIKSNALFFFLFSVIITFVLFFILDAITYILKVPLEASAGTKDYLRVSFIGILAISFFNLNTGVLRGKGDSKTPLFIILFAGAVNIILDIIFVKKSGVTGAAWATVLSQVLSVLLSLFFIRQDWRGGVRGVRADVINLQDGGQQVPGSHEARIVDNNKTRSIIEVLKIGAPIAAQDFLIQISFLVITAIANTLGLEVAGSVAVVERVISFLFLVNTAMLGAVNVLSAQNIGNPKRARKALLWGVLCVSIAGAVILIICQIFPRNILRLFTKDNLFIALGADYLRAYSLDCMMAGVHFCFSGYFCAMGHSLYSFIHNMISVIFFRIPLAYLAAQIFLVCGNNLYFMGLAAPVGSFISILICLYLFRRQALELNPNLNKR